jgi:hypothetical protein
LDNNFRIGKLYSSFKFELKSDAKVIKIECDSDIDKSISDGIMLMDADRSINTDRYYFDFEKLKNDGWDAIEVYMNTPKIYFYLYGWDCDSILVLNPDCIIPFD